ncbi:MAG: ferritin family protein [Calditrichia bacterium]
MPFLSQEALHALQMAIQNEQDTIQIYEQMLKQVKNSNTGKMLRWLIAEEQQHMKQMKEKVEKSAEQPVEVDPDLESEVPNREQLMEIELENCTVTELIDLAIENEKISRDFYREQQMRSKVPGVSSVFEWLVAEEEKHISKLQKEYHTYQNYEEVGLSNPESSEEEK